MVKDSELFAHQSAYVAPLFSRKDEICASSTASSYSRNTPTRGLKDTRTSIASTQMTPPATPNGSQEDLHQYVDFQQPMFHNFLRAFHPFQPTYAISDSTVTLPLNEGDVILVHSIHTNGWADGTLLVSGARGWLPTNYCVAYDPDSMRNLLKAMLNFWDLMRSGYINDSEIFGNQEFMRGIIAGVRYLLEKSHCLTRESLLVSTNEGLRRTRKALLSDLSALVKSAKRLQEYTGPRSPKPPVDDVNNTIDKMILKAFKMVTRGVKFLDVLEDDMRSRDTPAPVHKGMATVVEEAYNLPTPPTDLTSFDGTPQSESAYEVESRRSSSRSSGSVRTAEEQTNRLSYKHKRTSTSQSSSSNTPSRPLSVSGSASVQMKRRSISHCLSVRLSSGSRHNLVSERLNLSHDTLLSFLGSFIGRLHLQSQSTADLIAAVRQSVTAARDLLKSVEMVCEHDTQSADALDACRGSMYERINNLVSAAREIINSAGIDDGEDVVMPQQHGRLLLAATACVKAAGECVAKTKFVIERIGDFEFELHGEGLGIDIASIGVAVAVEPVVEEAAPAEPASGPPPTPLIIPIYEKPLPDVPAGTISTEQNGAGRSLPTLASMAEGFTTKSDTTSDSRRSLRLSLLPPLPSMTGPLMICEDYSPSESSANNDGDYRNSFRVGTMAVSSIGTSSTYLSSMRDSETSMLSRSSTRATSPDLSAYIPRNQPSLSDLSNPGSQSTIADDIDDAEKRMLERTFAHELIYHKDTFVIIGGTLRALVERLTNHDSTPDSIFVSTFYLTFRLFATSTELAEALVYRFDYVAENPHIAAPVRLRVYNAFKGWLESHWRASSDHAALDTIVSFAQDNLAKVLPSAGRRLTELAQKVSSTGGPLVPRLVSSMGKTSTAAAQYIPADTPLPPTQTTRSQMNSLRSWKMGGSNPTILEFEPLELARQLTIKEMNIFCSIMPEELLDSEWTKRSGSNAVNVRAMSTFSTDLSNLVADTVLFYDDAKKRAAVIKHWIKIAHKCLELNNYDSLMAIICSLNSSTIIRLKRTWDIVSQKRKDMLKFLQSIVDTEKNYAVLRRRLHDHVPPCLPFVGMYLTDLTFVDAGNASLRQHHDLGDGETMVINYDKHTRTAKIICELQRFQIPYRLNEIPEMQEWIQAQIVRVKSSSDNENVSQYYRKSLLLEPREALHCRQRPEEIQQGISAISKDKFNDMFSWTHSRDRTPLVLS